MKSTSLLLYIFQTQQFLFRYPVTVTVETDTNAYLNAPSVSICPLARLSCRRLASAMLEEPHDETSSKIIMKPPQSLSDNDTSTFSSDDNEGQDVPANNSRYFILRQLFEVAKCCQTLQYSQLSKDNSAELGCLSFGGGVWVSM